MFNALKYIRSLEQVGFKREQAEAQVQLVMDSYEENVATKVDLNSSLAELRSELKIDISDVRTEMANLRAEMKSGFAAQSDLFIKFSGLVVGAITLATGILGFLIKF